MPVAIALCSDKMRLIRFAFYLLLLIAAAAYVSTASTVVLSGTCAQGATGFGGNANVEFTLSNSGNAQASNITLVPRFYGAFARSLHANAIQAGAIAPGSSRHFSLNITGLTVPGEYIFGIMAEYRQQSSTFFASFPCTFYYERSNLTDYVSVQSLNYSKGKLMVSVYDIAPTPVNLSLYLIAPPQVDFRPQILNFSANPNGSSTATFNFSTQKLPGIQNASYSIGIAAAYMYGGAYRSSLVNFVFNPYATQASHSQNLIGYAFIFIVAALIALIAASAVRGRKLKKKTNADQNA